MTNAERQSRYRSRKRNGRNAKRPQIAAVDVLRSDTWKDGIQRIYLGDWGFGPCYATVVNSVAKPS